MAARAVPRLMAVVVLPTPPFWLARARTLGRADSLWVDGVPSLIMLTALCEGVDPHDASLRIGATRQQLRLESPGFRRLGQFAFHLAALGKEPDGAACQQRFGPGQQLRERRQRPGRDYFSAGKAAYHGLKTCGVDPDRRPGEPDHMPQEGAFAPVALDEVDLHPRALKRGNAKHQAGKPGTRAKVKPSPGPRREVQKLQGVGNVPRPHGFEGFGTNEVFHALPAPELLGEGIEPPKCFT